MSTTQSTLGARDILSIARGIQAARDVVLPMLHAALDDELRISTAPGDIDLAALDAAGDLSGTYGAIQSHLQDCIIRIMAGREDNVPDLFARLERDAQAELDAALTRSTYRIHTEAYVSTHRVATEEEALDEYARDAGYRDYAELADTLGKTVEEAKADLTIEYRRSIRDSAERARTAPTLLRLWDAVADYVEACRDQRVEHEKGGLDLGELPTFGGEEPFNLHFPPDSIRSVLSWDETHLLLRTYSAEQRFVVVARSVYA
ncbi:hypothetical protein [Methylobacterium oryzae]|uniref:hypothetical protein n=1 Tax=Methylobacterium oryzae TaxID=334852 RepID=UPI002F34CAF7